MPGGEGGMPGGMPGGFPGGFPGAGGFPGGQPTSGTSKKDPKVDDVDWEQFYFKKFCIMMSC